YGGRAQAGGTCQGRDVVPRDVFHRGIQQLQRVGAAGGLSGMKLQAQAFTDVAGGNADRFEILHRGQYALDAIRVDVGRGTQVFANRVPVFEVAVVVDGIDQGQGDVG